MAFAAGIQVDDDVNDALRSRSVYIGKNGYPYFSTNAGGPQTLHAFVMGGSRPGFHIDHIDGDRLNNRRSNLRFVSFTTNQVNRKRLNKNNSSGHRGVSHYPKASRSRPWRAQITASGRAIHIGMFSTLDEAIEARKQAELELFGEVCP